MNLKSLLLSLILGFSFGTTAFADTQALSVPTEDSQNIMDELDPSAPGIEELLEQMDQVYYEQTGDFPFSSAFDLYAGKKKSKCFRASCKVWVQIVKSQQKMYLYVDGQRQYTWSVSTGVGRYATPNFDMHPNGRIYDKYSSKKYPGGGYGLLGNMPYAVFITGGYAIHGTGRGNWKKLGKPASHGCIRLHPDNAKIFNRLVRQVGIYNTWITVQ